MRGLTNSRSGGGSNLNLLDNWDFTNPVNQRGQSAYTGVGTYAIDRWKFPDRTGTLTVKSGGIGISFKSPETFTSIGQYFENLESLIGKTVTASILLSDGIIRSVTFKNLTANSDVSGADFNGGYLNLLMPYNCFRVMIIENSSITIKAVKLELGSVSTLKNDLLGVSYDKELYKCQKYLQIIRNESNNEYVTIFDSVPWQVTRDFIAYRLIRPMRKTPVLTYVNIRAQTANGYFYPINIYIEQDDTIISEDVPLVKLRIESADNTNYPLPNEAYLMNIGAKGYIMFSADL